MENSLKTTPLNQWHRDAGANMADFGGYDMPLWYDTGVKNEHLAVINSAGIFDTSHMACIRVEGDHAFDLLQYCFTRDLTPLKPGRCVYGAFLDHNGFSVDDAIVYKFDESLYMVCVNAGMGGVITEHLNSNNTGFSVEVTDLSGQVAKMDIQGKNSAKILSQVLKNPESVFETMPYFSFKGHFDPANSFADDVRLKNDTPLLLSRSGYTGEFGFEIFIAPDAIVQLWKDILGAGKPFDIMACGLGSRDSLRAGAVLPLSHQDIGDWVFVNHPWDFALPYSQDKKTFTKPFLGRKAIESYSGSDYIVPFAGDTLRKVGSGKDTQVLDSDGKTIGHVLTCATDMAIGWHGDRILSIASPDLPDGFKAKGISCGFIKVSLNIEPGTTLELVEGKRKIKVTVLSDIRPDRTARKKISHFI